MVVDPQPTARYHPLNSIETEEHRKNRGWLVGERKKKTEPGSETERNRTKENFGPSTSSTSCFYHHCLRLRRRRSDRELEKGTNWRRGSNTGNTTRRAKTERKRSRHRGEKTNTKGRKQRTKPSFGLVPDSSITQNKTEQENKERRTTRENRHRHLLNSSIPRTEKTEEHKEKAEKAVGTAAKESKRQGQTQTGGTTTLQPSSSSLEAGTPIPLLFSVFNKTLNTV